VSAGGSEGTYDHGVDNGITVTGTGEASQAPDTFRAQLTVGCERSDVSSALSAMAERMSRVARSLRELGLRDEHLQTTGARVHPRYGRDDVTVVGYRASQGLAVICPDLSKGGECLTAAAEAGGNDLGIDGISLEISDPEPLRVLARERAFTEAHSKAVEYAALAGRDLGALESLQEGGGIARREGGPMYVSAAPTRGSVDIEGGESTVSVTVTGRWSLGD
jgi:uncharacterized protein